MKTRILIIFIALFNATSAIAQDKLSTLLAEARQHFSNREYSVSLVQALEANQLATKESRKIEVCSSALLLSEIYRETNQFNESLEFGLQCKGAARSISEEYYLASYLSLINLFGKWGSWEKQLEYIDALEAEVYMSENLVWDLKELKSTCLYNLGRYDESAPLLNESITRHRELGNLNKSYKGIMDMALLERKRGDFNSSIMYLMSLTTPEYASLTKLDQSIIENNIGELYLKLGKYQKALEHLTIAEKSISISDQAYSLVYINLAMVFYRMDDYDHSIKALDKAISKSTVLGEWHSLSLAQSLKAKLYSSKGDFSTSIDAANVALNAAEKSGEAQLLSDVYALLSGIHKKNGNDEQSREFEDKSKKLNSEIGQYNLRLDQERSELFVVISNKEKSILSRIDAAEAESSRLEVELATAKRDKDLTQLKYEKELQDAALFNEQVAKEKAIKELALVQAALMAEQQRFTIVELEKAKSNEQLKVSQLSNQQAERDRGIQLLKKQNELLNSEQQRKDLEIQKDTALKKSGFAILIFVSILLVFAVIAYFSTKKKNRQIKRNQEAISLINGQLKEKNEEITASIVFAKNFQEMIIPNEDSFRECMPNSFLIYQPMDIVSGDIPFILDQDDRMYIGAIDCTGHGVPAAMQSFMAYYNLNELIGEFPNDSCADLLMKLHKKLSVSTNKSEKERSFTSGIDIGLCCIVKSTLQLEFAGANQPLLLLTKDGIDKIQGDRFTVGDMSSKQALSLTNHKRDLFIGDRFYLLSDGFIHQFGGEDGNKKYSLKRLMQEIVNQKVNSHIRTKLNLEEDMRAWKGSTDQTDDIMLIGMEISEPIILK